jgi:metal-responsive CopG/Arc/MetJ family transcriptional regulator
MTSINLRLSETFLDDIDASWLAEGFNSRSEFMRYVLRDAVKHSGLARETWKSIAATSTSFGQVTPNSFPAKKQSIK